MASLVTTTVAGTASITATTNDGSTAPLTVTQAGTARAAYVTRNVASATRAMADFAQLHSGGGAHPALHIQQTTTASDALRITSDGATAKFAVTGTGALTATSGTFTGAVTAGASSTFSVAANLHNYFYINTASAGYNAVLGFAEATNRQAYINYDTTNYRLNLVCEANNGSIYLLPNGSGNVNLYYGAANKLQTVTGGVNVNGTLTSSAVTTGAVTGTTGLFESSGGANTLTVSTNSGAADCNLDLLEQVAGVSDGIYGARIRYDGSANKFHIGTVAANTETIAMTINRGSSDVTVIGALTIGAYTLPTVVGTAGYHLQTDGAGAVTWQPGGGGTVTGSGTDNYIPRWNGTTALHNSIIYDSGASVGISSVAFSSPAGTLHTQAVGSNITYLDAYSLTDGTGSMMIFRKSASATVGKTQTGSGDSLGTFSFYGVNSNASPDWGLGAGINISQEGVSGTSYVPAHIAFATCTASAYGERMRIASGGNVGIGTNNPANDLQVGSVGASNFAGNHFAFGNGTKACAFFQSNTFSNIYTSIAYKFWVSGTTALTIDSFTDATFAGNIGVEGDFTNVENLYVNQDASFNGSIFQPVQIVNNFSGYNGALGWNTFWQEQNGWSNSGSAYTFWIKLGTVTRTAANAYADFVAYVDIYGDDDVQNGLDQFYFKLSTTPNVSSIAFVGRNGSFSANRLSKVKVIRTSTNANPTTGTVTWDIWMKLAGGWLNSFLLKWNYGYGASQFSVAFTRNQSEVTSEPSGEDNKTEDDFTNTTFFAGKAKVGIGTTAPNFALQVDEGTTTTYAASIRNAADNLQLKLGTTTGALLNIQGSIISTGAAYNISLQADGGNVGIGTTAASSPLTVRADTTNGSYIAYFYNFGSQSGDHGPNFQIAGSSSAQYAFRVNTAANYPYGSNALVVKGDGKVGINTDTPGEILTLNSASNTRLLLQEANVDKGQIAAGGGGLYIQNLAGDVIFRNISDADTVRIKNDGKVGIGTTNPAGLLTVRRNDAATGGQLVIEQDSTGDATLRWLLTSTQSWMAGIDNSDSDKFKISSDGTGVETATKLTIQTDGNLGIANTAPKAKLHVGTSPLVASDISTTAVFATNVAGAAYPLTISNTDTATNGDSARMSFSFWNSWSATAWIGAVIENTVGALTGLGFATYGPGGLVERVRIATDGNVGIGGSTSLDNKLEILGNLRLRNAPSTNPSIKLNNGSVEVVALELDTGATGVLGLRDHSLNIDVNGNVGIGTTSSSSTLTLNGNQYALAFSRNTGTDTTWTISSDANNFYLSDDANVTYNMTWQNDGNVGIGVTAPATKLEVASGNIRLTDAYVIEWGGTKARIGGSNSGDYLRFYTDDTARLEIISNGNVGIGTITPTRQLEVQKFFAAASGTAILRITSRHSGSYTGASQLEFAYNDSGNVNVPNLLATINALSSVTSSTNVGGILTFSTKALGGATTALPVARMTIRHDGNVGIGTTAPTQLLEIYKAGNDTQMLVQAYGGTDNSTQAGVWFRTDNSSAGSYARSKGAVIFRRTGSYGVGNLYLCVQSNANSSSAAVGDAKLTIIQDGNVGIGTTSPSGKLSVQNASTAATSLLLANQSGGTGDYQQIVFQYTQADTSYRSAIRSRVQEGGVHGGNLSFWTDQHASTTLTERMTIDRVGNVGIGDSTPTYKLDVNGTGRFTGALTASSFSGNGASISALNALNISAGTVGTARLGSGTANSSTFLAGNNTWATPANTTYSAGTGLTLSSTTFSTKLDELTDMTADVVGSQDELILLDNGSDRRKQINEIKLGQFNNDQGWTSNAGTVTTAFTQIQNAAGTVQFSATTATNKLEFQGDGITIGMNATGGVNSVPQLAFSVSTNSVDEGNLKISNAGTNGHFLQKQSGNTGGMTWSKDGSLLESLNGTYISSGTVAAGRLGSGSSITSKFLRGDNTWQTVSSGGDTVSITASADDILSVSSGAISGVDANTDKLVYWDEGLGKLKYLTFSDLTALP